MPFGLCRLKAFNSGNIFSFLVRAKLPPLEPGWRIAANLRRRRWVKIATHEVSKFLRVRKKDGCSSNYQYHSYK
jgi:hypothetical protein